MSAYEELVERIYPIIVNAYGRISATDAAVDILAEVLRTLEMVTPEMRDARREVLSTDGFDIHRVQWLAMLRASALNPVLS